jgi:regulatory protein
MAGRRGARSGRGWDAIPPRPADHEDSPGGELRPDGSERGNVPGRRRRGSPADSPYTTFGASGTTSSSSRGSYGKSRRARRSDPADGSLFGSNAAATPDEAAAATPEARPAAGDRSPGRGFGSGEPSSRGSGDEAFTRRGNGADPGFGDAAGPARRSGGAGTGSGFGDGSPGRGRRGNAADRPPEPPRTESEVAREICLRQLAVRPRTRAELTKALIRKEISEETIAEVLDRYDEVGIIDDAAFARMWVSTRHQGRGLARRALANELRQRGVDAEVASEALETVDDEAEATAARALVDRKLRTARGTPDQVFRRLVGMLARKGYPAGIAIRAVKDALAARDEEAAEFADQIDADALADEATENLA